MKILLSVCRVSLLWSEWHQLHQILTHCDYERQHTQMMLLLMFSIENGENWEQLWENRTGKYTQNSLMEHNSCPLLPGKCLLHILMKLVTIEFSHKKELRLKGINLQRESGFTIPSYLKWTYHAQICQKKKNQFTCSCLRLLQFINTLGFYREMRGTVWPEKDWAETEVEPLETRWHSKIGKTVFFIPLLGWTYSMQTVYSVIWCDIWRLEMSHVYALSRTKLNEMRKELCQS